LIIEQEDNITNDPYKDALAVGPKLETISSTFCLAKWKWSSIHLTNGWTNSCFLPPIHKIDKNEIESNPRALHNTKEKKDQRRMMLKGERPDGCSSCWKVEDMGKDYISDRHYRSSEPWALPNFDEVIECGWKNDINPSYLEINFNHACQMKCSYCSPHLSSTWAKEIQDYGPYPTIVPHNNIQYFKDINQWPIPHKEYNPYVEAFWKWWPELYPSLKSFRMTGGEPLLDKNTFRVLEYVISNPRPDLEISITTNASVPEDNWNKFIDMVSFIMDNKMLKRFRLFISVDAWGEEAEYIRNGLDFEKLWYNANNFLSKVNEGLLTFIITTNVFSIFSIQKLMENILHLQRVHNIKTVKRKKGTNLNLQYYGYHRVFLDTPILMYPTWQSLQLVPKELWHYLDDCLEFMNKNKDNGRDSRWVGFKEHQINRFERAIGFMKQGFNSETELAESIQNFKLFFTEHDKRRNTSINKVFPELTKVMHI